MQGERCRERGGKAEAYWRGWNSLGDGSENGFLGKRLASLNWKGDSKGETGELLQVRRTWGGKRSEVGGKAWQPQELTLALDMEMMQTQMSDKPCSAHTLKSK